MSGVVIWLTGLPASGKSTLAARAHAELGRLGVCSCVLDSDAVRDALVPSPGYAPAERDAFYATLANLAALLAAQGVAVLVPATAHRRAFRDRARQLAPRWAEVYVRATANECAARDIKGLYDAARTGEVSDLPGIGVEYEPPLDPDVIADGGRDRDAVTAIATIARGRLAEPARAM